MPAGGPCYGNRRHLLHHLHPDTRGGILVNQTQDIQQTTRAQLLPALAWNSAFNHSRIRKMFRRESHCLADLSHHPGRKAMVIGSGPSLDTALPYIAKGWDGLVFASASQLNILRHWGITPDYIVAVDSRDDVAAQVADYHLFTPRLLTHPGVSPKVLKAWKGKVSLFRLGFEGEWAELQATVYPWLKASVQPQGCVVATSIQIAEYLECRPIVLAGVDFAVIDGRGRATDYTHQGMGLDIVKPQDPRDQGIHDAEMDYYHTMLLAVWKTRKTEIWQVEPHPAARLKEFPGVALAALNGPFPTYIDPDRIDKIVDRALKKKGVYVHPPVDGSAKIEYLE